MIWSEADYAALSALVFRPDYPGNATARGVVEAPGGDPGARDVGKRYSHVAMKYLLNLARPLPQYDNYPHGGGLTLYTKLVSANQEALHIARQLRVPDAFMPDFDAGCLRVLEYPRGVGASAVHADVSLFTINLYRSTPNAGLGGNPYHMGRIGELVGLGAAEPHWVDPLPEVQRAIVYFAIPAHSAVLPGGHGTVGEWLERELKGMRYPK